MAYREVTLSDIAPFGLATELQRTDCRDVINVLLKNNISPAAICAVLGCITGESHFKRDAVSPRGFKGIFQCKDSYILYANGRTPPYNSGKVQAERWVEKLPGKKGRKSLFMKYGRPGYDYGSTPPSNCKHDLQTPPNCCWIYGCEFEGVSTLTVLQNTNDNNLKYGVDGVLWTYFRCCASEAHSDNRYKAANKFANIINRVCGSNVKKITNFTPAWGNTEPWKGGFVCGQQGSSSQDIPTETPTYQEMNINVSSTGNITTSSVNPFLLAICGQLLDMDLSNHKMNINTAPQIKGIDVVYEGGTNTEQMAINVKGDVSLNTREGRARYIFNYFNQRGVPTNSILGIMSNLHRTTAGMEYPYNRWQVDTKHKYAGGGLRGNITYINRNNKVDGTTVSLINRYYKRGTPLYNQKETALEIAKKAAITAASYSGDPNTNESARYMLENIPEGFPVPIDTQLLDIYDDIKDTELMKPIYTPKQASDKFRYDLNNPGLKNDPTRRNDRWEKNGDEIIEDLTGVKQQK